MTRGLLVALVFCGCASVGGDDAGSCFVVAPTTTFDFGESPSGDDLALTSKAFTISNPTGTTRTVNVGPRPTGFLVSPQTARLVPGGQTPGAVTFFPRDPRVHLGEVVLSDELGCEVRLTLRGVGAGDLRSVPLLDFGYVPVGSEKVLELPVINTRRRAVPLVGLRLPAQFRLAGTLPTEVPAASSVAVPIVAAPIALGRTTGEAVVQTPFGELSTTLTMFTVQPRAALSPGSLSAVRVGPGLELRRTLVLSNRAPPVADGSELLTLEGAFFDVRQVDGGVPLDVAITPQGSLGEGLRGGQRGEILIRLTAGETLGPAAGELRVFTNDPVEPVQRFTFSVSVEPLPECALTRPPGPVELVARGDGGSSAQLRFEADGGACVLDDVALIIGSAPGLHLLGAEAAQHTPPLEVELVAPTPATRQRVGAVHYHLLQQGEGVELIDVYANP